MSTPGPTLHTPAENVSTPAALAKIRSLARPRFDPRSFAKTISPIEISVVIVLLVAIVGIAMVYSSRVLPGQIRLAQLSSEQTSKARTIEGLRSKVSDPASIRLAYDQSVASLERFRGEILTPRLPGRVAIVRGIDRLTSATGVRLLGGVTFATSVPSDDDDKSDEKPKSKRRSASTEKKQGVGVYSSMRFSLTVAGQYDNLRAFIREIEGGQQFVVIESVSVVPAESEASDDDEGAAPGTGLPPGTLTLKVTLTAYFQPEAGWDTIQEIASSEAAESGA